MNGGAGGQGLAKNVPLFKGHGGPLHELGVQKMKGRDVLSPYLLISPIVGRAFFLEVGVMDVELDAAEGGGFEGGLAEILAGT